MLGKNHNQSLIISCTPQYLRLLLLTVNEKQKISLSAYSKKKLEQLECEKLILFNPTKVSDYIAQFLQRYNLNNVTTHIALYGGLLTDRIISLTTANPTETQFPISHEPSWQWEYHYLYPHDNRYYFYFCEIQKPLLLQYELLALQTGLDLCTITTERIGLLHAYRHIFGAAFRSAHLGNDLMNVNNIVENLFTKDDVSRIISVPDDLALDQHDMIPLLSATGLFIGNA